LIQLPAAETGITHPNRSSIPVYYSVFYMILGDISNWHFGISGVGNAFKL